MTIWFLKFSMWAINQLPQIMTGKYVLVFFFFFFFLLASIPQPERTFVPSLAWSSKVCTSFARSTNCSPVTGSDKSLQINMWMNNNRACPEILDFMKLWVTLGLNYTEVLPLPLIKKTPTNRYRSSSEAKWIMKLGCISDLCYFFFFFNYLLV